MSRPRTVYWWEETDPHTAIVATVKYIDNEQQNIYELNLRNLMLYGNRAAIGLSASDYTDKYTLPNQRLTINVIQSVIDAAVSQIATIKPRVLNLTEKGSWSQQQRARKLNQWTQGVFYETKAYQLGKVAFRDACIFGTGVLKVCEENGRAALQRVFIDDIIVDSRDARNGDPRQMFEVRELPRNVIAAAFPEKADWIDRAGNSMRVHNSITSRATDLISVAEAWHLPSSPDAKDGRHVICVDNCTLLDEPWKHDYFPYAVMRWGLSPLGWYGWGISEQLTGIQLEINYLLQKIQKLMTLATSQLWVRKGSGIDTNKMSNEDWAIREFGTEPPIHLNVRSVSPEYFQWVSQLVQRAYEVTGVNQLTAQAEKPAGLNSGKALDTYQDVQSQRFMEVTQAYETFYVDLSNLLADKTAEIAKRDGKYRVRARSRKGFELLDWKDVKMDRDDYITQPYPTNFFPQTPAGKWNQIQQMIEAGFLGAEEAGELLDYPDLDAVTSRKNAPFEYVTKVIDDIMNHGEARQPDPYTPLQTAMDLIPLEILRAEQDGAPEDRIDMLRDYLDGVQRLIQESTPQPVAGPPPLEAMPPPEAGLPLPGEEPTALPPELPAEAILPSGVTP